jgi:hypothetical protein
MVWEMHCGDEQKTIECGMQKILQECSEMVADALSKRRQYHIDGHARTHTQARNRAMQR